MTLKPDAKISLQLAALMVLLVLFVAVFLWTLEETALF